MKNCFLKSYSKTYLANKLSHIYLCKHRIHKTPIPWKRNKSHFKFILKDMKEQNHKPPKDFVCIYHTKIIILNRQFKSPLRNERHVLIIKILTTFSQKKKKNLPSHITEHKKNRQIIITIKKILYSSNHLSIRRHTHKFPEIRQI